MTEWRPEEKEWAELINKCCEERFKVEGRTDWQFYVEVGADAILKALVKEADDRKIWFDKADDGHILIYLEDIRCHYDPSSRLP